MNGFEVYKIYLALKSHFKQDSYDFFKYGGKTRASTTTFLNRKDSYFFEKLAKKHTTESITNYLLANLVHNENLWIGEVFDSQCDKVYIDWQRRQESISYVFSKDCETILDHIERKGLQFDDVFKCHGIDHPIILKLLLQNTITVESFVILDCMLNFTKELNDKLKDDYVWKEIGRKCERYKPFLPSCAAQAKYKKIIIEKIKKYDLQG